MESDDFIMCGFVSSGFICDLVHRARGVAAMGDVAGRALGGDSLINLLRLRASFVCGLRRG